SDLIENNIDIIGIGKDAMAVIDDSLDLSQPVHRSVVWFLVLAHRGPRLVALGALGKDFAEARTAALGSSDWSRALPIPSTFSDTHARISALRILRNSPRSTSTAFGHR